MTNREAPATRCGRGFCAPLGSAVTAKFRFRWYSVSPISLTGFHQKKETPPRSHGSRWRRALAISRVGLTTRTRATGAGRLRLLFFLFGIFVNDALGDLG